MSPEDIIADREKSYGDYHENSALAQRLKNAVHVRLLCRFGSGYRQRVPSEVLETMDQICSKLSRLANGDVMHRDSYVDISNYALLVVREIDRRAEKDPPAA